MLDKTLLNENIFDALDSEVHEKQLSALMDNIMFTNEEKKGYMEMIMYCLDF